MDVILFSTCTKHLFSQRLFELKACFFKYVTRLDWSRQIHSRRSCICEDMINWMAYSNWAACADRTGLIATKLTITCDLHLINGTLIHLTGILDSARMLFLYSPYHTFFASVQIRRACWISNVVQDISGVSRSTKTAGSWSSAKFVVAGECPVRADTVQLLWSWRNRKHL